MNVSKFWDGRVHVKKSIVKRYRLASFDLIVRSMTVYFFFLSVFFFFFFFLAVVRCSLCMKAVKRHLYFDIVLVLFEPRREKTYRLTCAPNEGSAQPAHPRSLTRVFVVCKKKESWLSEMRPVEILIRLR